MKKGHLLYLILSLLTVTLSQPSSTLILQRPENCLKELNLYWTGFRCACRVGYVQILGECQKIALPQTQQAFRPSEFIFKISKLYRTIECSQPNERSDGLQCICIEGYFRNQTGSCQQIKVCPNNSIFINGNCVCNSGFQLDNELCVKICPQNSQDNGFGECVCIQKHYKNEFGNCVFGQKCPQNSSRDASGNCVCDPGFIKNVFNDGQVNCVRCPEGTYWNAQRFKCQIICSENAQFNPSSGKCQCKQGYALFQQVCQICPTNFFISNNYCVLCPLFAQVVNNNCVCIEGYTLNGMGFCVNVCTKMNQFFNPITKQCACIPGFGYEGNACVVCQNGIDTTTGQCKQGCGANQVLSNQGCICMNGFGLDSNQNCIDCMGIDGGIEVDGFCALCPNGFIRSGNACECPSGQINQGGRCLQQCSQGQLVDSNGICYFCLVNEVPMNGICECRPGFQRKMQRCQPMCQQGQFIINGICGRCALDTVYDTLSQQCVCSPGFFKNNFGFCQKSVLRPVTCQVGFYSKVGQGCLRCPEGCASCESAEKCNSCTTAGHIVMGGRCMAPCGNSIIDIGEQCDDGNSIGSEGCSNMCMIENGWRCEGQPSRCEMIQVPIMMCGDGKKEGSEECDDGNTISGDGCSSTCKTQAQIPDQGMRLISYSANSKNVFIIIQTETLFRFNTETQMRNFIQYEFENNLEPNSAFCMQDFNPLMFRCLFVYASGVPNTNFNVFLKYNRDGKAGYLKVEVDPLRTNFALRSLV